MIEDKPVRAAKADTMGALDRQLVRDMLAAVCVGEKLLFEDFERVFGTKWRNTAIYETLGAALNRLRGQGRCIVTIRHVGYLRLPDGELPRRLVFSHLDREIWAMAERAPRAKLPV